MRNLSELMTLTKRFAENILFYKNVRNAYNEHSCRIEYIDRLFKILGWDVANKKGAAPQYREVVVENYSTNTDRPDYTFTLRGVAKFFVEAKKPVVDILKDADSAIQARKYGWNAKHRIAVLTNFEHLVIYDTGYAPSDNDLSSRARYRVFHFSEYVERYNEIAALISREAVYSGKFDEYLDSEFPAVGGQKQPIDKLFLSQINSWRIALSNELYEKGGRYTSLEVLNDVVQEFINQIVFIRICEDKNLPLYHHLKDTFADSTQLHDKLEKLFRSADRRYNSGMFTGEDIVFDLSSDVIIGMITGLYYPQSPYLFNIIEPNMLGKIYEVFLTEQLILLPDGSIGLGKKKDCRNRSVVTTPAEIVKYMVDKTLYRLCSAKTPAEILQLHIADIACGSGIFLEEAFSYLQNYCVQWYIEANQINHLIEIAPGTYKLPFEEKKQILCSCIYGIDIDIHAVEVAKFSLLIKLIENETAPSVSAVAPILPDLYKNIYFGNSLVSCDQLKGFPVSNEQMIDIAPLNWSSVSDGCGFDAIIGNPPYVNTEDMRTFLPSVEIEIYKKNYQSAYKQFDKYFIFIEQAINKTIAGGFICFIVPNKFFKIGAGEKLRQLIAKEQLLVSLDDFGDTQLFDDKTIYSSIILLQKSAQDTFLYNSVDSASALWAGDKVSSIEFNTSILNKLPWRLTADLEFLSLLRHLDEVAVPITKYAEIFNGIQTSAEKPTPVYWFSTEEIVSETDHIVEIYRNGKKHRIERVLLRSYFKPTRQAEKGLNSYSILKTDKQIIFPYSTDGRLISIEEMRARYPGTYSYLEDNYDRLLPKSVSTTGTRDVPGATKDTWYQYGRTQALTAFINTPKLVVGILSKNPMYVLDTNDILIASGGTAGYCAISRKKESPYALEYIQAWLSHPITERILEIIGSDFEGGFIARGTFVLSALPFVELNFNDPTQKKMYDRVVEASQEIYAINEEPWDQLPKKVISSLEQQKQSLINEVQRIIARIYGLDFKG